MNIRAVLKEVTAELAKAGSPSAKLDAELILAKMLDHPREWLIANDRTELTASQKNNYDALIKRRLSHEPVSYINQSIEFYGLDFFVDKRVLSPRVETEMIVERTIQDAPPNGMVLDMGTGSGAIAIALCKHRPDLEIVATDISNDALEVARINAVKLLGNDHKIDLRMADIWEGIGTSFDVVATNLPYVSKDYKKNMKPEVLNEPAIALFGGEGDGLDLYRKFYQGLNEHLKDGGLVYHESDPWQHESLKKLAATAGLVPCFEDYLILGFKKPNSKPRA